ncbi:Na+/H+ antiporter [Nitratireductor sp. GCM10026969]|uniref:Na+/H+ antiporter n=1 Tax=Nitratireductor sp. GCM10026969 TaxID=3252645 RepID=UPI00361E0563
MEIIATILVLILSVVISGAIARALPVPLPLPVVQIGLGAFLAAIADLKVELHPDVFFLLFLPPLLFLDGWRIPKEGLLRDRETILALAFGLVVFTVLGLGFFIHWMIPAMPLAVAFALAAVISPTDPVAVSGIAARVPVPKRLMHVLEGESLLNDASGLVCMRFAVAAALTGAFSLVDAVGTFLWLATGGVAIGIGVTWGVTKVQEMVARRIGEEVGAHILVSLLIPFGAYLLADRLGCSAILAAVAAGITMSYADQSRAGLASTRVNRTAVWDTLQFAANGTIFVLLGEQIPDIIGDASEAVSEADHFDPALLAIYVLAITGMLALLRFVWAWVTLRFILFRASRQSQRVRSPGWRLLAATTLAGARGAVTLAGVLTLPLAMTDGAPFPARELAVFLAAGVIVVSLLAASIGLPFVLKGLKLPPEPSLQEKEDRARVAAAEAAIKAVTRAQRAPDARYGDGELYTEAGARVIEAYRLRIDGNTKTGDEAERARAIDRVERELRLSALRAERDELFRLRRMREISEEQARELIREIDLLETHLTAS